MTALAQADGSTSGALAAGARCVLPRKGSPCSRQTLRSTHSAHLLLSWRRC
jgi:hypothetical protein